MHGNGPEMTRKAPYFRHLRVVEFLHSVLAGVRARSGTGLPEVLIAIAVFGTGVLGVVSIGSAARRMAHVAATRSAQVLSADGELEQTASVAPETLAVTVDTVVVAPGLIELRVTVAGAGPAAKRVWVARRSYSSP
jgi:predicted lysophospholipase L1 biosynthesis ABC-type transport system permease subunit